MTPELVIGVVVCNLVCPDVNVKMNVKASYGLSVSLCWDSNLESGIVHGAGQ